MIISAITIVAEIVTSRDITLSRGVICFGGMVWLCCILVTHYALLPTIFASYFISFRSIRVAHTFPKHYLLLLLAYQRVQPAQHVS